MRNIEKSKFFNNLNFLKNKSILITGGTGSFGEAMVNKLLTFGDLKKIVVFSRDEYKQFLMKEKFKKNKKFNRLRFFIGDVRDYDRLVMAFRTIDYVIHAAALKQIDTAEYNPFEYVRTNIIGAENIVKASLQCSIKKVIALSTDKAVNPINLYGATKLAADKVFIAANNYAGNRNSIFSVVRYGNVLDSRGSVISLYKKLLSEKKELPVTDRKMTRFWIKKQEGVDFSIQCLKNMEGTEIFVPKIPSMSMDQLLLIIGNKNKIKKINIRPGEKLHEKLIAKEDTRNTYEGKNYFIILPSWKIAKYNIKNKRIKKVPENFEYTSDNNKEKINKKIIKDLFSLS